MNKIIINDNEIIKNCSDINIQEQNEEIIKNLSLDILNDTVLELEYNIEKEIVLNLKFNIKDNVSFKITSKKVGNKFKVKAHYILGENSSLIINKINDGQNIKEYDVCDLNGENSSVKYILKTICDNNEKYDILINHNVKNTSSDVITNGLNISDGTLQLNVTGFIPKGSSNSYLNQDNQIINLTNNKCLVNPNLLIDEVNVSANHSAHISNFNKDDLFYIESRGVSEKEARMLLIKGFLSSKLELIDATYIDELIQKYWR